MNNSWLDGVVLVVDDDPFQQELTGQQLREIGCSEVLFADSGTAALELYESHRTRIRLVITDLSMPDMDGLVLMRHFATRKLDAHLILMSGVSDEILNSAAGLASAHQLLLLGVLSKPNTLEALANLIAKMDGQAHRRKVATDASLTPETPASGARQRRICALVSTQGEPAERQSRGRRSTGALAGIRQTHGESR